MTRAGQNLQPVKLRFPSDFRLNKLCLNTLIILLSSLRNVTRDISMKSMKFLVSFRVLLIFLLLVVASKCVWKYEGQECTSHDECHFPWKCHSTIGATVYKPWKGKEGTAKDPGTCICPGEPPCDLHRKKNEDCFGNDECVYPPYKCLVIDDDERPWKGSNDASKDKPGTCVCADEPCENGHKLGDVCDAKSKEEGASGYLRFCKKPWECRTAKDVAINEASREDGIKEGKCSCPKEKVKVKVSSNRERTRRYHVKGKEVCKSGSDPVWYPSILLSIPAVLPSLLLIFSS